MRIIFLYIILLIGFLPAKSTTKRALLVGISDYPENKSVQEATWTSIHGANDVLLIEKTLKNQGFKVKTLTNANATASKIRKALNKLLSESMTGDMVYIHFSTHGQPVEDLDGDESDGWDESIIPYDAWKKPIKNEYEGKNHILDDELNVILGKIRQKVGTSGFVYVVIDACHAGGFDRGEEEDYIRGTKAGFTFTNKDYVPRMDARSNIPIQAVSGWADVCMLEACRAYQSNCEIIQGGSYYGPLSYYINQTLLHHQLSSDTHWTETVRRMMNDNPKLSKQNMVIQSTKRK